MSLDSAPAYGRLPFGRFLLKPTLANIGTEKAGDSMGLREMITAERAELVEFLRTFSDDDWLVPSRCQGWSWWCTTRSARMTLGMVRLAQPRPTVASSPLISSAVGTSRA